MSFEAEDRLAAALALALFAFQVGAYRCVDAALGNGDPMQRAVELPVADAGVAGELRIALEAVGRADLAEQLGGAERSAAGEREQVRRESRRALLQFALANTLNARYAQQEDAPQALLSEVRELLSPIAEGSNLVEHRGGALVGLSVADQLVGDLEVASTTAAPASSTSVG